mgnify:CR=1 FL=1
MNSKGTYETLSTRSEELYLSIMALTYKYSSLCCLLCDWWPEPRLPTRLSSTVGEQFPDGGSHRLTVRCERRGDRPCRRDVTCRYAPPQSRPDATFGFLTSVVDCHRTRNVCLCRRWRTAGCGTSPSPPWRAALRSGHPKRWTDNTRGSDRIGRTAAGDTFSVAAC